jgi:hypothetical protein
MEEQNQERRKYKRYNTEVKIYFDFSFDLQTKVHYEVIDKKKKKPLPGKYTAISRNISVEGICIVSDRELKKGDDLQMELYLPSSNKPILMQGTVKWCSPSKPPEEIKDKNEKLQYLAGVLVSTVNGESVPDSIYYDEEYKVDWSRVLESVFGNYKLLMGGKYRKESK